MAKKYSRARKVRKHRIQCGVGTSVSARRPLNRFEAESDSAGVSASAKKLKVGDEDFDVKCEFGYRIINFFAIFLCHFATREV